MRCCSNRKYLKQNLVHGSKPAKRKSYELLSSIHSWFLTVDPKITKNISNTIFRKTHKPLLLNLKHFFACLQTSNALF